MQLQTGMEYGFFKKDSGWFIGTLASIEIIGGKRRVFYHVQNKDGLMVKCTAIQSKEQLQFFNAREAERVKKLSTFVPLKKYATVDDHIQDLNEQLENLRTLCDGQELQIREREKANKDLYESNKGLFDKVKMLERVISEMHKKLQESDKRFSDLKDKQIIYPSEYPTCFCLSCYCSRCKLRRKDWDMAIEEIKKLNP